MQRITTLAQLDALYEDVASAAVRKQTAFIHPVYRAWIEAAPFAVLATAGPAGLDASPRGDPYQVVRVVDERTLWLPDRPGNNRIDSLRNIVADPRVALLFLVPGVRETLRVAGRASITTDAATVAACAMNGRAPRCVVVIEVDQVFFQCGRAIHRSLLWSGASPRSAPRVPSAGDMLAAVTDGEVGGADYDATLPERQRRTLF